MARRDRDKQLTQRRRLLAGAILAVLALAALAAVFAWRQYGDGKQHALREIDARVVSVSAIVDAYFSEQVALLQAVAASPTVRSGDVQGMSAYFPRIQRRAGDQFKGGLGWVDLNGTSLASSRPVAGTPVNVADRSYFRNVVRTRKPYISGGLASKSDGRRKIVVTAVPTFDRAGRLSGVLAGARRLKPSSTNKRSIDLGFGDLVILDRDGRVLTLRSFPTPKNAALLARMRQRKTELLADTHGLDGSGGRVVAYATSPQPGWITVIDRSSGSVFSAARRSLELELVSIAAALLLVLGLLIWVYRRSKRNALAERRLTKIRTELTRALAEAAAPTAVADALADALAAAYPGALAVVGVASEEKPELALASVRGKGLPALARERPTTLAPAAAAYEGGESIELCGHTEVGNRFPELQRDSDRHVGAVYAAPILGGTGRKLGAVSLLFGAPDRLTDNERASIGVKIEQAAQALTRTLRQEREHEVAVALQRSLLPEALPAADGLEFATRYHAGGVGVEVGGDWYDVVRRRDGIFHVSVGDVAGRGIPAATLMAQLRNAFRAYALDHDSPAEITRRLSRHVPDGGMVTTVCLAIDPFTRRYAYSLAGHPPVLVLDRASGVVAELADGGAPPLGFATPEAIDERDGDLPPRALLLAYTDGLVERRGAGIDDGIALVSSILAAHGTDSAEQVADDVLGGATAESGADDDAALILVDTGDVPARMDIEIPADPAVMTTVRRRLQAWMTLRGIGENERVDAVLAVHEACINAIEHGYQLEGGTIRLLLEHDGDVLRIHVEDQGQWRPPTPDPSRGRGIQIMETAMHATRIEHGRNGTRVALEQRLKIS